MRDTIYRQDATNALWAERERLDNFMEQCLETGQMEPRSYAKAERNQVEKDIYIINDLPTAQPERKKGRWISADAIYHGVPFYCSECGENTRDTVMMKPRWNFCPNCGSDMRGEQDEAD